LMFEDILLRMRKIDGKGFDGMKGREVEMVHWKLRRTEMFGVGKQKGWRARGSKFGHEPPCPPPHPPSIVTLELHR
jgi:hypothetical protein